MIDRAREKVWRKMPRSRKKMGMVDLDSTIKEVYGQCKRGADFSYNGKWSYHPFLATLGETNEPLHTINRPGKIRSQALPRYIHFLRACDILASPPGVRFREKP